MSFTNELSNFNASMEVTELLMKTLENAARNLAARCISEVASRHGFDAEKEIQALGLENLSLIRKQMAKRTAVTKEKKPREPKKSAFPLPFFAENVNTDGCQGLAYNRGLFTQCTKNKCETGLYCKGCQIEADKNSSGAPDCGNVSSRLATGLYEFKDPKGRSPISYIKVIKKLNITLEQVSEETGKTIPCEHLVVVEKKLSGRGRPKKISAVETDDLSTVISDIFAKINLNANDEEVIEEEVIEEEVEEEEVFEVVDKPKKAILSDAEKAEKKAALEAEKTEKAEKKAALEAEKAEKAEQKRLLEVEKAEKKAALEAEKAEQKRLLEVEKAEKKAALEAEKLEKKRLLEVEKAEKKEKEKEQRKSKRDAEKGTQKTKKDKHEKKDDSDNESEKSEKSEKPDPPAKAKEAETPPAPSSKVKVSRIQISGKSYLKTVDNVLYDPDTRDEVGLWDPDTKTIKPLPEDDEDEEEQEEDYDSN